MISPRLPALALSFALAATLATGCALAQEQLAQDKPMLAPPGQSDGGPRPDAGRAPDDKGGDQARPVAKSDDGGKSDKKDDDLERARAAARAVDPRLQGLERARAAARAADPSGGVDCLSAREARGAIGAKRAVPLALALRTARSSWDGEVIDYKLCTFDGALAYDLTLLNSDGRVARVRVDAANGKLVGVR